MGANIKIISISNRLKIIIKGIVGRIIFLLLFLCSLTNLEIAIGSPRDDRVINRLNVGNIREYIPIPFVVIVLVRTIFINIPSILVRNPPKIKMIIDFKKLFFIIKYMMYFL